MRFRQIHRARGWVPVPGIGSWRSYPLISHVVLCGGNASRQRRPSIYASRPPLKRGEFPRGSGRKCAPERSPSARGAGAPGRRTSSPSVPLPETMPSRSIQHAWRKIVAPSPVIASLSWMPSHIAFFLARTSFPTRFLRCSRGSGRTSCHPPP